MQGRIPCPIWMRPGKALKSGLTLVELLVVIAIIGILAALLLGTLASAKKKAQKSQCANNVRQLGLALQEFVMDNQAYPLAINTNQAANSEHESVWCAALQGVLGRSHPNGPNSLLVNSADYPFDKGIWLCPRASRPGNWPTNVGYVSYAYNAWGMGDRKQMLGLGGHGFWDVATPIRSSEISNPSEMMAVGDSFMGGNGIVVDGALGLWRTNAPADFWIQSGSFPHPDEDTARSAARHNGAANIVFCDGHMESQTLKYLFEDTSEAALSHWNRDHLPHREKIAP